MIDAAYVINLDRRTDRNDHFTQQLSEVIDWPLPVVQRLPGVDGALMQAQGLEMIRAWGNWGSMGCWMSHMKILNDARDHGHRSIAVFEDDAVIGPHFGKHFRELVEAVPNWEALYLGGEHVRRPVPVHGVLRVRMTVRTHAYVVRDHALDALLDELGNFAGRYPHDWQQALTLSFFRTYAPERFFVGQMGGYSDCTGKVEEFRNWDL